jgi:hypothetical protein
MVLHGKSPIDDTMILNTRKPSREVLACIRPNLSDGKEVTIVTKAAKASPMAIFGCYWHLDV